MVIIWNIKDLNNDYVEVNDILSINKRFDEDK